MLSFAVGRRVVICKRSILPKLAVCKRRRRKGPDDRLPVQLESFLIQQVRGVGEQPQVVVDAIPDHEIDELTRRNCAGENVCRPVVTVDQPRVQRGVESLQTGVRKRDGPLVLGGIGEQGITGGLILYIKVEKRVRSVDAELRLDAVTETDFDPLPSAWGTCLFLPQTW